jgi:hypothetical protein
MRAVAPLVKVGIAFAASALLTYFLGDALLRRRGSMLDHESRLRDRVRGRIADLVSYPHEIQVRVEGGLVHLSGRVLAGELDRLLSQLTQVPRVFRVYNALDAVRDESAFNVPQDDRLGNSGPASAP